MQALHQLRELEDLKPRRKGGDGSLTKCTWIGFSRKKLTSVPSGISMLTNLRDLYLSQNSLTSLPSCISLLTKITGLEIRDNPIEVLPEAITNLVGLKYLYIESEGHIYVQRGPRAISCLPCWTNSIKWHRMNMTIADALSTLELYDRVHGAEQLTSISHLIKAWSEFESIDLSLNRLATLQGPLTQLNNLRKLNLSRNKFTEFPAPLLKVTWIESLDISHNKISHLPQDIGDLGDLYYLDISWNQIERLPTVMGNLELLKRGLFVEGNPVINVPENVINHGSESIIDFLFGLSSGTLKWTQGRLLLLGESESGKTSLIRSMSQKSIFFKSAVEEQIERTDGIVHVDADESVFSGSHQTKISVKIWDFGGRDDFQVTHPFFLSSGALVLILYRLDQSKRKNNLDRWVRMLNDFAPGCKVIMVGTHKDKQNMQRVEEMKKEIDVLRSENKRHNYLNTKIHISNKRGDGIAELKQTIYQGMLQLDNINKEIPKSYLQLKEYFEEMSSSIKYMNIEDVYTFTNKAFKLNERKSESALRFLHDLGSIIWYSSLEKLKGIVFIDPLFLINVFRCVFSFKGLGKDSSGIIIMSQLEQKINHEFNIRMDERVFSIILDIFDHFGLGIRYNQECIAFPYFMELNENMKVIWNQEAESDCISEMNMELFLKHSIHASDQSNIIIQMLRLASKTEPGLPYGNIFFKNMALTHLATYMDFSDESKIDLPGYMEFKLVPGYGLRVLIQIHENKIGITVRKYDMRDEMQFIDIFKALNYLKQQISSIRPNFIRFCRMDCYECRVHGTNGYIQLPVNYENTEINKCSIGHELEFKNVRRGHVFREEGLPSKSLMCVKPPRKLESDSVDESSAILSIDTELVHMWTSDEFHLVEFLGMGTYGRVYRAKKTNDTELVVKVQTIQPIGEQRIQKIVESLILECKFQSECSECENIVKIFNTYRRDFDFCMVMEYAGISLRRMMDKQRYGLKPLQIIQYSKQICQGLIFMMARDLYHEDLNANNILISNGAVKIADFGTVSRRSAERVGSNLPTRFGDWQQGGTSNWQAPEIYEVVCTPSLDDTRLYGEYHINVGHRGEPSLVYAFGLLVWYMFSGVEPFLHETKPQSFTIAGIRPTVPSQAPKEFQRLIRACWKQNYKFRPSLQLVVGYIEDILCSKVRVGDERLEETLPIRYSPLDKMYKGELVELLRDHGCFALGEKFREEAWSYAEEIKGRLTEERLLELYYIGSGDSVFFANLACQPVEPGSFAKEKAAIRELSHLELVEYMKKKKDLLKCAKYITKVESLGLNGEILSRLDQGDVRSRYHVPAQEIVTAARLLAGLAVRERR